jgi:hypothetical protein
MAVSTVAYTESGQTVHWTCAHELVCGECGYTWPDRLTTVKCLICPQCAARVSRDDAPESTVTLEVLHQWAPQDFADGPYLLAVGGSLSVTFAMRAPLYFWDELHRYPHNRGWMRMALPFTERDFSVAPGPLALELLNAAYAANDSAALLALTPQGLYRTGTLVLAYRTLDQMAEDNRWNPLYEWQKFLALAKASVQLLELCPALERVQEDAEL